MAISRSWFAEHRRATTLGVLGVAMLLVAAAAVLVANLIASAPIADPGSSSAASLEPSAEASTSASPTIGATAVPAPSATPSPAVAYGGPFAAIVLVNDLNVRGEPGTGSAIASLDAGEVVWVQEGPRAVDAADWYLISRLPDVNGWASAGPADGPYLDLRHRVANNAPAKVTGLVGATAGYVAYGSLAQTLPGEPLVFVAASTDGATWWILHGDQVPEGVGSAATVTVAHGPSGWLMATSNAENTAIAGMWLSNDGGTWTLLDIPAALDGRAPTRLTGFESGYAFTMRDPTTGTPVLFTSADAVSWQGVALPGDAYDVWIVEVGGGLVAWSEDPTREGPDGRAMVLYSAGGTAWIDASQGGARAQITGSAVSVGRIGEDLVAISHDTVNDLGAIMVWRATPAASGFDWIRQLTAEEQLADTAIETFVELPDATLAIGHSFDDGHLQVWRTADGSSWQEVDVSTVESEAGIGPITVGGAGIVAVGYEVTAAGANPYFMRSSDGASWQREAAPILPLVESAVAGACPEPPSTMVDWLAVPGAVGAECFGNAPIAFRAWLTQGGGCGGFVPGQFEPWLAHPFAMLEIVLEPNEAEHGGCGSAVRHPDLELPERQQWVELTGHWADPAAAECRTVPLRDQQQWVQHASRGPSALPFICRTMFVATEATPASAP